MSAEAECERVTPYAGCAEGKTGQVKEMFDNIAPAYDFMNRAMTLGVDRSWRRRTVEAVAAAGARRILDVATGTGDLALQMARSMPDARITGVDLSAGMIEVGRRKIAGAGEAERISLEVADCLALPMADGSFDAVTVAYGVRNFESLARGYAEMARVLRPGGLLAVLELTEPEQSLVRPLYKLYTRGIIPLVGKLVSGDSAAYRYLPRSIAAVPSGEAMLRLMRDAGLENASARRMTFGVCTLYTAFKRQTD